MNDIGFCILPFGLLNLILAALPDSRRKLPRRDLQVIGGVTLGIGVLCMFMM